MTTGLSLVATAVLAGTVTLWLARNTQHDTYAWRFGEQAAVASCTGLLAGAVTTFDEGYGLVPFAVLGGAAAVVDAVELRLPDVLTGGLAAATAILMAVDGLLTTSADRSVRAALTAAGVCAVALAAKLIQTSLVGWGDVKFMISLAAVLGWWSPTTIVTGLILWAALILITAALVSALHTDGSSDVPYGPALLLGTFGALAAAG